MKRILASLIVLFAIRASALIIAGSCMTSGQTNGPVPLTVYFTNHVSGATNWTWDFGDGTTGYSAGTNSDTSHIYTEPGTYTVLLTSTDGTTTSACSNVAFIVALGGLTPPTEKIGLVAPIKWQTNFTAGQVTVFSSWISTTSCWAVVRQPVNTTYAYVNEQFDIRTNGTSATFTSSNPSDTAAVSIILFP